jgi:hypothetical protein
MKYYLHDTSAFEDEKITELYMSFGYEGVGLFFVLLEKIAKQEKPIKTDVLKRQLRVGKRLEKCWSFMESLGIISSSNGETFNEQLLKFSEKYQIKKEKNAKRISEWRENKQLTKNVTHYEHVSNTPKVKESKVKESKGNRERETRTQFAPPTVQECIEEFSRKNFPSPETEAHAFWNHYDAKGWVIGKSKMKNWKSALAGWIGRAPSFNVSRINANGTAKKSVPTIASSQESLNSINADFAEIERRHYGNSRS